MSRSSELHTIHARIEHETDKAILINYDEAEQAIWIPLSQKVEITRVEPAPEADIVLTAWIAREKGII